MKSKTFLNKLTKAERAHFRYAATDRRSVKGFKETLDYQKSHGIKCYECLEIARKLGIETAA